MIPPQFYQPTRPAHAFSLVEVVLALGLTSFCLLAVMGMIPAGLSQNQNSVEKTVAANIACAIVADLRNAPAAGTSPTYGFTLPTAGSASSMANGSPQVLYFSGEGCVSGSVGAAPVTSGSNSSRYRATVGFMPPASGEKAPYIVRLLVSWPAMGTQSSGWPTNSAGSYEVVSALDQN